MKGLFHLSGVAKLKSRAKSKPAKILIRQNVLAEIGAERAIVFDAFAGAGEMHKAVWSGARAYVGCDKDRQRDGRLMFCCDNVRVLRAIGLSTFNVFDLDAFGSPWEQATIIAARRIAAPGEKIGIVITDGTGLNLKLGGQPTALVRLSGIIQRTEGLFRSQGFVINRAIAELARRMNARVMRRWDAEGVTGAAVKYIGLVLEGLPAGERVAVADPVELVD